MSDVNPLANAVSVSLTNSVAVNGFQFVLVNAAGDIKIPTSASGGSAQDAQFLVQTGKYICSGMRK